MGTRAGAEVPACGAPRSTPCPVTRRLPCDRHRSPARCAADRPAQRRLGPAPPRTPAAAATCAVAPAGALPHGHRPRPALSSAAASREHCTAPQKPNLATVLPRCSIPAAPRPLPRGSPDCGRTSGASGPARRPPSVRTRTRRADESHPGMDRYRGRSRARARLPQSHPRRRPRHTLLRPDPVAARPEPRLSQLSPIALRSAWTPWFSRLRACSTSRSGQSQATSLSRLCGRDRELASRARSASLCFCVAGPVSVLPLSHRDGPPSSRRKSIVRLNSGSDGSKAVVKEE